MNKLLVICGPTATGKTELAFYLAKKFNSTLLSADSRMVYKHMDIGTGKDIHKYGKILGYDLVEPNEEFSVSNYLRFAREKISEIQKQNKLPILVGGSGLYIKAVTDGIQTSEIMPNKILRENLKDKTSHELFKILKNEDSLYANNMNESDRQNPRRLMRAIEITSDLTQKIDQEKENYNILFIGLIVDKEVLKERINERVEKRVTAGFEEEIKFLKEKGFWEGAPRFTLGYKEWPNIEKWKLMEFKYAKRQLTWFKKDKRINWFDITTSSFKKEVENLTKKWYSQADATQN
jgi:tRNA dimethylallyltransferase